jgi:protein-L-isoaspartate O-methyltransferase
VSALLEAPLETAPVALPEAAAAFVAEGLRRGEGIDCFDFVPSDAAVVYAVLAALPRGRLCEWGSGMGIVTGLAEMLGFEACGIEIDAKLAAASRALLADFALSARIETGDYFDRTPEADFYFAYCWPGQMRRVEKRFASAAPDSARLLICHGAEDVRCKVKPGV